MIRYILPPGGQVSVNNSKRLKSLHASRNLTYHHVEFVVKTDDI